jgi:hypothetical protein
MTELPFASGVYVNVPFSISLAEKPTNSLTEKLGTAILPEIFGF